jgi:hypothetical protein
MLRTIVRAAVAAAACLSLLATAVPAGAVKQGIGDSVMRGAADELRHRGFRVDTAVSRQFSDAPRIIRNLREAGRLPRKVVIHLGNNGYLERADCRRAVNAAGNRHVYLVTLKVPRGWRRTNNRRLHACARRFDNASIVDWFGHAVNHPGWFYDDGYHLTPLGQRRYAGFLAHQT